MIQNIAAVLMNIPGDAMKTEYEWLIDWQMIVRFKASKVSGAAPVVKYKASTLMGFVSVLNAFHKYTGKGILQTQCPVLQNNILKWAKLERTKKSATMPRIKLEQFLNLPDTADNLPKKAYICVGLVFAGRGKEAVNLNHDDLQRMQSADGSASYRIRFQRSKPTEASSSDEDYLFLHGSVRVAIIDRYLAAFTPPTDQKLPNAADGRLWRKLKDTRHGFTAGAQVLGKNTIAKFGYDAAKAVGYIEEEARKFTGHWIRRTAITHAAESGLSLAQIKTMTGAHYFLVASSIPLKLLLL